VEVSEAYKNLEKIIMYGFLSVRISLYGHNLLIKSISDKEYSYLDMICSEGDIYKLNLLNLAFCTVSIDGLNIIEDRNSFLEEVVAFYKQVPAILTEKIIRALNDLNRGYIESLSFLEGFCYSERSRNIWSILDVYNRSAYLGIKGIDYLGINSIQESWVYINKKLDDEKKYSAELNNTLLIVSATNQKGAKAIAKNYENQIQETKELRKEICKYGYDKKRVEENKKKREKWTAPLQSREDLVRELYRQMSGKKDKHDLFINGWVEKQKERAELAKRSVEEKSRVFNEKINRAGLDLMEPSKAISSEELNERLKDKDKKDPNKVFMPESNGVERRERVLKKMSAKIIRPEMKGI
jgi:hypothetical protein